MIFFNKKARRIIINAHLYVRCTVSGQVDVEAVVHAVTAQLLVDQDDPVVLHRLARLNDGAHRWQGRHVPLNVATWVVRRRLDEWTVVLYVQDAECHLIFWICEKTTGQKNVLRFTQSNDR